MARKPYPSDVTDEQWLFLRPYLTLMRPDAPQRRHDLRECLDALLYLVRTGCQWRALPNDLPPWHAVYDQARRWMRAGAFDAVVHDLRAALRVRLGRDPNPSQMIVDAKVLRSTPESGPRAGYDGHRRVRGSKLHAGVDTLGMLLSLHVTPADVQERQEVGATVAMAQAVSDGRIGVAYVDQGYTGKDAADEARAAGVELVVVKAPEARKGFLLLPKRWVVERSFAWVGRFRRLARDLERLPEVLAGLHWVAFAWLMLQRFGDPSA